MNLLELMVKIGVDDQASAKIAAIGSNVSRGMGAVGKVAGVAFAAVSAATVAFGKSAVDAGMQFDSAMSQVAATMGTTVDQIGDLREFAQEMGASTAFSATQAAEALNYMALAGYDAQTSMSMLPNVLNLAAAGGMELAEASDMVTDAQSALGLSLSETTDMVDQMAAASSKTNTSVQQLGSAILTVGGTAKNLSGGTVELSQALGLLADNGIKGAQGGTALRNILLAISTEKFEESFGALGVAAYDTEGNMRSLKDIFQDMNGVMKDMTVEEKTKLISEAFNKVDLKSVNALLGTNAERWDEVAAAIDDSAGAAGRMAETQLDNLQGDVTLFKSALEGLQIALSDKLTPTLREFVQFGGSGLQELTEALQKGGIEGFADKFAQLVELGLAKLNQMMPKLIEAGAKVTAAVVSGIVKGLPTVAAAFGEAFMGIASNATLMVPAIAAAFAAFQKFASFAPIIKNPYVAAFMGIATVIALVVNAVEGAQRRNEEYAKATDGLVRACTDTVPSLEASADGLDAQGDAADRARVSIDDLVRSQAELSDKIAERNDKAQDDINSLERARDVIHDYMNKTDLTTREQGKLREAVETVNKTCGTQYEVLDAVNGVIADENGAIQETTESIDGYIAKFKEKIRTEALGDNLKDLYAQQADDVAALSQAYGDLAKAESDLEFLKELGYSESSEEWLKQADAVARARAEYDRVSKAANATDDAIKATETAMGAAADVAANGAASVRDLALASADVQAAFKDSPAAMDDFASALEEAGVSMDDFSSMGRDKIVALAKQFEMSGGDMAAAMRQAGVKASSNAGDMVNKVTQKLNAASPRFKASAASGIAAYAAAIASSNAPAKAMQIAGSVSSNLAVNGYGPGADAADGFERGILSRARSIADAAASIGKGAMDSLRSVLRSASPSKAMMEIGSYAGEGFALGILGTEGQVASAAYVLAEAAVPHVPQQRLGFAAAGGAYRGGDTYNITLEAGNDANAMVLELTSAIEARNRLNGRRTVGRNVRTV